MDKDIKMNDNHTTQSPQTTPEATVAHQAAKTKTDSTYRRPSYKHLWLGLLGLLLILVLVGLIAHQTTKTKPQAAIHSSQVSIQSSGFFPKTIQVKAGTTVAWTNYDSSPHQVASDPYPKDDKLASLNSLAMAPNDTFSYTFNSKGTFTYHDNLHPYKLQGTVVVR